MAKIKRRRIKSYVLRVDSSFRELIKDIQREAKRKYNIKLNSQEASKIAMRTIKFKK